MFALWPAQQIISHRHISIFAGFIKPTETRSVTKSRSQRYKDMKIQIQMVYTKSGALEQWRQVWLPFSARSFVTSLHNIFSGPPPNSSVFYIWTQRSASQVSWPRFYGFPSSSARWHLSICRPCTHNCLVISGPFLCARHVWILLATWSQRNAVTFVYLSYFAHCAHVVRRKIATD